MSLEPIVAEVTVPVTPTEAFVGFTAQMGEWWDPMLTPDPATFYGGGAAGYTDYPTYTA